MPVIQPLDLESAPEASVKLLEAVEGEIKRPLNILRTLAHSPAMLDSYLRFFRAFNQASAPASVRTLLSATVAQIMGGEYMLAAVTAFGGREGLSPAEIEAARHVKSNDPKTEAALKFTATAVKQLGQVPPSEVEALRQAGYSDREIVELIGAIALDIWRNLFTLTAGIEVDFSPVKLNEPLPQASSA